MKFRRFRQPETKVAHTHTAEAAHRQDPLLNLARTEEREPNARMVESEDPLWKARVQHEALHKRVDSATGGPLDKLNGI